MRIIEQLAVFRQNKQILLDSNLLLLLMVGSFDRALIPIFKRTQAFTVLHYSQIVEVLESFSSLITTPHILTEVSNLANALPASRKPDWGRHFAGQIKLFKEMVEPSEIVAQHKLFPEFGLTDAAIALLTENTLVLTQDGRLAARLNEVHFCALDFKALSQIKAAYQPGSF